MTLPHRDFTDIVIRVLVGHSDNNAFNSIDKFTNDHVEGNHIGHYYEDISAPDKSFWKWYVLIRSLSATLETSMDQVVDYGVAITATIDNNPENCGQFLFDSHTMVDPLIGDDPNQWNENLVTGKHSDGVIIPWDNYPQSAHRGLYSPTLQAVNAPYSLFYFIRSYFGAPWGQIYGERFCRNGLLFEYSNMANCDHFFGSVSGDIFDGHMQAHLIRINFFNPVVNSISHPSIRPGETPIVILTGLGFNQDDIELNSTERNPLNAVGAVWNSLVDRIYFVGQQGQGTVDIFRVAGDFSVDSDNQITITNMPTLAEGTYHIRLEKTAVGPGGGFGNVEAYAGDWIAASDGAVRPGTRFLLLVTEAEDVETPKGTMFFTKWAFKAKDGSKIFQYWAPIDVRSTDRFYDGRLISESGITRSIDDRSGLPNISDMSVDVAVDKEIRQLLAGYMLKNQLVDLYFGWANQPEAWKQNIITMIVDDHELEGDVLKVTLKDITQKYFRISIPRYIITIDDYPHVHESAIGQPMSEALGLCSKIDDPPGAIAAQYINTNTFKYLALRGSAHAILEVYSNGILMDEGAGDDYTISYEDGGRTYINFNADQGDNKITFNCEGYMFAAWNSLNGYIQNPAYIIGFLFAFLAEIPVALLDLNAIDELAAIFETRAGGDICGSSGECEWAGYLILQDFQPVETAAQELNFTYGVKVWPDRDGRFTFGIKDIANYQSDIWIFEQIDALKPSARKENLREMMNFVKALYGNIPTASAYSGSIEESRPALIIDYEAQIEAADSPWKFPWTNSIDLVSMRVQDELYKRGSGMKEIHFQLAIDWIFALDIFDSFIYQNPFAPTLSGHGQRQWYYYVKSLSFNFVDNTINVIGIDLQWLLRQCVVIGICADMAESWLLATEEMRMFGYVCECELSGIGAGFPDGEPCKKICPC